MTSIAEKRPYRGRSRLQHFTIQSAPLLLALIILAGMAATYIGLFYRQLSRFPGNFEWTSVVAPASSAAIRPSRMTRTRWQSRAISSVSLE